MCHRWARRGWDFDRGKADISSRPVLIASAVCRIGDISFNSLGYAATTIPFQQMLVTGLARSPLVTGRSFVVAHFGTALAVHHQPQRLFPFSIVCVSRCVPANTVCVDNPRVVRIHCRSAWSAVCQFPTESTADRKRIVCQLFFRRLVMTCRAV